jgi:hypothetical protein
VFVIFYFVVIKNVCTKKMKLLAVCLLLVVVTMAAIESLPKRLRMNVSSSLVYANNNQRRVTRSIESRPSDTHSRVDMKDIHIEALPRTKRAKRSGLMSLLYTGTRLMLDTKEWQEYEEQEENRTKNDGCHLVRRESEITNLIRLADGEEVVYPPIYYEYKCIFVKKYSTRCPYPMREEEAFFISETYQEFVQLTSVRCVPSATTFNNTIDIVIINKEDKTRHVKHVYNHPTACRCSYNFTSRDF